MHVARFMCAVLLCLALFRHEPALADDARMQVFYAAGNFVAAADEGVAHDTPDALAFASFALLRHVMSLEPGTATSHHMALVKRAVGYAQQALASDPDHVNARVNLAIALGLEAMEMGSWDAYQDGVGKEVRAHLEQALMSEPEHIWGRLTLGGWHLEVVRKGGLPGRMIFNASRDEGLNHIDRVLNLEPTNIIVLQQVAALFIATKDKGLQARASMLLDTALEQMPEDYFEQTVLAKCQSLQDALAAGDRKEAAKVAIGQIEIF